MNGPPTNEVWGYARPAAVRSPLGYGGMPRRPRARLVGRVCNEPYTKLLQNRRTSYSNRRTLFTEPWDRTFYRTVGPNFLQNRGTERTFYRTVGAAFLAPLSGAHIGYIRYIVSERVWGYALAAVSRHEYGVRGYAVDSFWWPIHTLPPIWAKSSASSSERLSLLRGSTTFYNGRCSVRTRGEIAPPKIPCAMADVAARFT